jgi:hypothetical protein
MTGLRIELRRAAMLIAMPVLVFLGVFAVLSKQPAGVTLWPSINAGLSVSLMLLAPLAAGIAAWAGGREHRRRTGYLTALSSRRPEAVRLVQIAPTLIWAALAALLAIAVTFTLTAVRTKWGGPALLWTISPVIGLAFTAAIGFVIGRVVNWRFTPLVVAASTYVALAYNQTRYGHWAWTGLSPVQTVTGTVFWKFNNALGTGLILWFTGGTCLAICAWLIAEMRSSRAFGWPMAVAASLSGALSIAGVATVLSQHAIVFKQPAHATLVCSGSSPRLCLHPAFAAAAAELQPRLMLLDERLAGTPAHFDQADQKIRAGDPALGSATVSIAMDSLVSGYADAAVYEMVQAKLGAACEQAQGGSDQAARRQQVSFAIASMITDWLTAPADAQPDSNAATRISQQLGDPQLQTAVLSFQRSSEAQKRQLLQRLYPKITSCSATPQDLLGR